MSPGLPLLVALCLLSGVPYVPQAHAHDWGWVTTDAERYTDGGHVNITFTNPSNADVALPSLSPWKITDVTGQMTIYQPAELGELDTVHPGESRNWTYTPSHIAPGRYRVQVDVWDHGVLSSREAFFSFCGASRPSPWTTVDDASRLVFC